MAKIKPNSVPQIKREELIALINKHYPNYLKEHWKVDQFATVWIRGYYANSMGKPGVNDRAIYDDACIILTENEMHPFNANTDPSAYRAGIAKLVPNVYRGVYQFRNHNGSKGSYPAIGQSFAPVTVARDQGKLDTGMFGINQHKGGFKTTSSLGCQTIPPDQYDRWYATAKRLFKNIHGDNWQKASPTMILIEK